MKQTSNTLKLSKKSLISFLVMGTALPLMSYADTFDPFFNDASVSAGVSSYSDKNGIDIQDWHTSYEKGSENDYKVKLEAHHHSVGNDGNKDDYSGQSIAATVGKRTDKDTYIELHTGTTNLENQRTKRDTSFTNYKAKITGKPFKHFERAKEIKNLQNANVTAEYGESLLFSEALIADDNNQLLTGKTAKLSGSWRAAERVLVEGSTQFRKLSDGNTSGQHRAAVLYNISPEKKWMWAGVEAQSLSYDDKKNNYWSPEDYQAYAFVVTGNMAVNEKLSLDVNGNVNRTKEDNLDWASGNAFTVGANYKLDENARLKAHAGHSTSARANEDWDGTNFGVTYTRDLF